MRYRRQIVAWTILGVPLAVGLFVAWLFLGSTINWHAHWLICGGRDAVEVYNGDYFASTGRTYTAPGTIGYRSGFIFIDPPEGYFCSVSEARRAGYETYLERVQSRPDDL